MKSDEKTLSFLRKIKELSEKGVGGEKINATELLGKMLKKYNLSLDDLEGEDQKEIILTFHNEDEEKLLSQVIFKVFGSEEAMAGKIFKYRYGRGSRSQKIVRCTQGEATQIILLYNFYKAIWEREKEKFLRAFIHKNEIFGTTSKESDQELSLEEQLELIRMMSILKKETAPALQLEDGNHEK